MDNKRKSINQIGKHMNHKKTLTRTLVGLLICSFSAAALALKKDDGETSLSAAAGNPTTQGALSVMSDDEKREIGRLAKLTTRYQLNAEKEKVRVDYLKNRLNRMKLEKEIETVNNNNDVDINSLSGIAMPPMMNQPMPAPMMPSYSEPDIEAKKEPVKPKKPPRPYLIEVMGSGENVKAKIYYDGKTSEYQLGDPLAGSVLISIKSSSISLSNGKYYELGIN